MMPNIGTRRRRKRRHAELPGRSSSLVFWSCFLAFFLLLTTMMTAADAKEIEATNEWTRVGENDTVAAGMHVKMDLSTGEKWVKLIDDETEGEGSEQPQQIGDAQVTSTGMVVAQMDANGNVETTTTNAAEEEEPNYDFEMMHRTLSNLPPDEQERIGGIPELVPQTTTTVTPEQRQAFEASMKEIWEQRQAELKEFQNDHMADLPKILKDRIQSLREYLQDPAVALNALDLDTHDDSRAADILGVLKDLEYQLADVDMTRDFYTLGGWPLLTSFLADSVHETYQNVTAADNDGASDGGKLSDDDWNKVNLLQAHAAWTIGTAVKNTGEFAPYAVEKVEVLQQGETIKTTTLDLILAQFIASSQAVLVQDVVEKNDYYDSVMMKVHKTIYALGSLLRGNRVAQNHFCADQGPKLLGTVLGQLAEQQTGEKMSRDTVKVVQRLLSLAQDIVVDVTLHESQSSQVDEAIRNAFSSPQWCAGMIQFTQEPKLYETSLESIQQLASFCKESWDLEEVQKQVQEPPSQVREVWLPDDLDQDIRKERMALVEAAVQAIQSSAKQ